MEPITKQTAANSTVNQDAPVTGGEQQIIINNLQVRSIIRTSQDTENWRNAHRTDWRRQKKNVQYTP